MQKKLFTDLDRTANGVDHTRKLRQEASIRILRTGASAGPMS
jgi:hypothetical protein